MSYILPIFAVILGFLFVYWFKPTNQKNLKLLLAYSGGFLLAITVFHLLPEVFEVPEKNERVGIWIMVGILLQNVLEYFSKGAEHGHVHLAKDQSIFPTLLFVSLGIHALLEGFPMHHSEGMLIGIIVHKVPIAMILSTFLLQTQIKKWQVFLFLILFAVLTPLGSFVAAYFEIVQSIYTEITALVVGIFLHVSTTILFESTEGHKFNLAKFAVILLAIVMAYLL